MILSRFFFPAIVFQSLFQFVIKLWFLGSVFQYKLSILICVCNQLAERTTSGTERISSVYWYTWHLCERCVLYVLGSYISSNWSCSRETAEDWLESWSSGRYSSKWRVTNFNISYFILIHPFPHTSLPVLAPNPIYHSPFAMTVIYTLLTYFVCNRLSPSLLWCVVC